MIYKNLWITHSTDQRGDFYVIFPFYRHFLIKNRKG